jgi:uncharacterized heparinase superfamily protein
MSEWARRSEAAIVVASSPRSLLARLFGASRPQPLKLVAVPRDHVQGDRARGDACSPAASPLGSETLIAGRPRFRGGRREGPLAEQLQGFAWLRDLAAAASREKGAAWPKRSPGAGCSPTAPASTRPGRRSVGRADPLLDRLRALHPVEPRRRLSLGLLNTLARGARHLDANADKAPAGLPRITAWCGVVAAGLLVQGGPCRASRAARPGSPARSPPPSSTMAG